MASPVTVGRVEMETFNALMGHAHDITPHATMNLDKWPLSACLSLPLKSLRELARPYLRPHQIAQVRYLGAGIRKQWDFSFALSGDLELLSSSHPSSSAPVCLGPEV